jgi:hypothetical protein
MGNKNKNTSAIDSIQIDKHSNKTRSINNNNNIEEKFETINSHLVDNSDLQKIGWTTWLHNATHTLATIFPSNPSKFNMLMIVHH